MLIGSPSYNNAKLEITQYLPIREWINKLQYSATILFSNIKE